MRSISNQVRRESNRAGTTKQAKTQPARAAHGAPGQAAGQGRGAKERSKEVLVDLGPELHAKVKRKSAALGITPSELLELAIFYDLRNADPKFESPGARRILQKLERGGKVRFGAAAAEVTVTFRLSAARQHALELIAEWNHMSVEELISAGVVSAMEGQFDDMSSFALGRAGGDPKRKEMKWARKFFGPVAYYMYAHR